MSAAAGRLARTLLAALAATLLAALPFARAALAGTEEWSTFDVFAQEEDDESLIDHMLSRPPEAWRDEWEHSNRALRTSQGCLTSGQWMIDTDLKLRAPMGKTTRFGLDLRDAQSDRASFTYFDLSMRMPISGWGTPGFMFRPFHDKSRQDISLFWEARAETADVNVRATFTFEDAFNNFWAFRQNRVGDLSEPYLRRPYEPALAAWWRGARGRFEVEGEWLTPSRKELEFVTGSVPTTTLWGTHGRALAELILGDWKLSASGDNRQARSTGMLQPAPSDSGADFRRQWWAETGVQRRFGERVEVEGRWAYQARDQHSLPPYVQAEIFDIERVIQLEARWRGDHWGARVGGLHDRASVDKTGPIFSEGTRVESRAYFGFTARFGQVSLSGVEGIELDPEPYAVWFHHDKAFLNIQSTF
jgi:hypothetical protein